MGNNKMLKGFGFSKILAFLKKPKQREKAIAKAPLTEPSDLSPTSIGGKLLHPKFQQAKLEEIIPFGEKAILYRFSGEKFAYFRAGQYVNVLLQDGKALISRPISIVSSPKQAKQGTLELLIGKNEAGYFASRAHELLKVGETYTLSGPSGSFYYSSLRDKRHVIGCAGGIGITPLLCMAEAIAEGSEDFDLTILYGAKTEEEAIMKARLDEICTMTNRVKYRLIIDDKGEKFSAKLIQEVAENKPFSLFVCGPQGMYVAFDGIAQELQLDGRHYRKEIFGSFKDVSALPSYPGTDKPVYRLTVHLVDQTHELKARADEPLLYALEREGIATPNRCRGGVCGYCRAALLRGQVFIPESTDGRREEDKKRGYIHLCMAYPLSDIEIEATAP